MASESSCCPPPCHRQGTAGRASCSPGCNTQPGAEGTVTTTASAGEQCPASRDGAGRWTSRVSYGNPTYRKREDRAGTMPGLGRSSRGCGSALGFQPAGTITAACCHLQNVFYRRHSSCRESPTHLQSLTRASGRCLQGPAMTGFCSRINPKTCSPRC